MKKKRFQLQNSRITNSFSIFRNCRYKAELNGFILLFNFILPDLDSHTFLMFFFLKTLIQACNGVLLGNKLN